MKPIFYDFSPLLSSTYIEVKPIWEFFEKSMDFIADDSRYFFTGGIDGSSRWKINFWGVCYKSSTELFSKIDIIRIVTFFYVLSILGIGDALIAIASSSDSFFIKEL